MSTLVSLFVDAFASFNVLLLVIAIIILQIIL